MSIPEQGRILVVAPRVSVGREMIEAAALALSHAVARLQLPRFHLVWCDAPGGTLGATCWYPDGHIEVILNTGARLSPRLAAWTFLHEAHHLADGPERSRRFPYEREDAANAFAFSVTERPPSESDFLRLDWRPSGRR